MADAQREMVAVMFTDVSGYSTLAQKDEALALRLLELKRNLADPLIAAHHGRLVKTIGDALMVEFKSALDAVRCATELQRSLHEHNLHVPPEQHIRVRIGVHLGDVVRKDGDLFGDTVNIAARVEPQAPAGGVAITHAVYEQIHNKFEMPLHRLGAFHLKGIEGETALYAVVTPWGPAHPRSAGRKHPARSTYLAAAAAGLLVLAAGIGLWRLDRHPAPVGDAATAVPPQSVAVLPFENLSGDPNNAYFSAGIQDEVLTRLAQVGALKVVSRTSTLKYASHPENLKTVALELGVTAILEGSVQRSGDTARVNVQLIDAATDTHLWAETYDRDMKDIFSAESDIAGKIADALKTTLQPEESIRIAAIPTHDPVAYDLFLQAEYAANSISDQLLGGKAQDEAAIKAIGLYGAAIARDPGFMLAYAKRSIMESSTYFNGTLPSKHLDRDARRDAERALALDPASAQAHLAMGYVHYYVERDYAKALQEYTEAAKTSPNDPDLIMATAMVHRRRGEFEQAIQGFTQAAALDPANLTRYLGFIEVCDMALGRYDDALAIVARVAVLHPGIPQIQAERAVLHNLQGHFDQAREEIRSVPAEFGADEGVASVSYYIARYHHDPAAMLQALSPVKDTYFGELPVAVMRGDAYAMAHDEAKAEAEWAQADALLKPRQRSEANNADIWEATAYLEASRGNREAAIEAGRHAVALVPMSEDALNGPQYLYDLAVAEARVGDVPAALRDLETLLSRPYGNQTSIPLLRIDPDWDIVRKDPRFDALLDKYAAVKF